MKHVTCNHFRELISARVDDELGATEEPTLDHHLATCESCRAYEHQAWSLRRSFTLQPVATTSSEPTPVPDVAGPLGTISALRWALFVIGGTLIAIHAEAILSASATNAGHLGRHAAVFGAALGIGMLAVAYKPHRAIGLVPLTSAIALMMTFVAVVDLAAGSTRMVSEAAHVVEFAGLVCLWVISGGPSRAQGHIANTSRLLPLRRATASNVSEWPVA